jgi:hypothetical protein
MSYDYLRLENDLTELLCSIGSFNPSEAAEVSQFLAAGEYGLAFETLCAIATDEGRSIPLELRPKVRDLGERMGIDPIWWEELARDG